jgi:ABC-2 type transport system ATP-binding protein
LNEAGKTIILTTHIMEEADQLSSTIGIIDHGKMIAVDTPAELKSKNGSESLLEVFLKLTGKELRDSASNRVRMGMMRGPA